ncbi:MAG: aldehyde dehydrogenase [Phycisphaerae bacterium]
MLKIANYIDGQLVPPASGAYLDNIEPATGLVYSQVPDSDESDVERAVAAAEAAFPAWSHTPAAERGRIIERIAALCEAKAEELVKAESVDNGKPERLARAVDIPRVPANFRQFAAAVLTAHSECHPTDYQALNYTLRRPRGVAGIISPWNLPLYLISWKVAPALATGCTVVAKPSEITPMTAYLLSGICIEAGLPAGVLNIVHGSGAKAGAALVRHPRVPTISFTGGTVTGREIARVAAPMFKKVALEMGGKNPNVIFADADLDEVVAEGIRAAFANQGQICLCGSRVFVEAPIYERFLEQFVEAAKRWTVGDPKDEVDQGALVSAAQLEKVSSYVELAKQDGGDILFGGKQPPTINERCKDGYFFEPTVITGLPVECRVNQEEIFGPVVTIMPFETEDQVVEYANCTEYGLSASVWTQDVKRAHRMAERIDAGTVWINCWMVRDLRAPFGGMKQSGMGREGGQEALRIYTEPKNVCIKTSSSFE